jgi:hypothetical protein
VRPRQAKRPEASRASAVSVSAGPDEARTAGGMPVHGLDRSDERGAVRELSWAEFDQAVHALAREVHRRFTPDAVVGLVHGGVFVGGARASALDVEFYPVRVTARSRDHHSDDATEDLPAALAGLKVLLVDDIASSGDSLEFAVKLARAAGVKKVATAALLARPGRYEPAFTGFVSDEFVIFPWDYAPLVNDARFGEANRRRERPAAKEKPPPRARARKS